MTDTAMPSRPPPRSASSPSLSCAVRDDASAPTALARSRRIDRRAARRRTPCSSAGRSAPARSPGSPRKRARSRKARRIASATKCTYRGESRPIAREVVALEDVEHLDQRDAAGARRRHRDDLVAAIRAADRRALLRLVLREILLGDQPAVAPHLRGDQSRGLARVEAVAALVADARERTREIGRA